MTTLKESHSCCSFHMTASHGLIHGRMALGSRILWKNPREPAASMTPARDLRRADQSTKRGPATLWNKNK